MSMLSDVMVECMITLDVERAKRIWNEGFASDPPITSDAEMLATLHIARTMSKSVPRKLRFYSHCWLIDRGLRSKLPDEFLPLAQRMYPRIVSSVGISVGYQSDVLKPAVPIIRKAMEDAVREVYADSRGDDIPLVRERMFAAKHDAEEKLFGDIDKLRE